MRRHLRSRQIMVRFVLIGLFTGCAGGGSSREGSSVERAEFHGHHSGSGGQPPMMNPNTEDSAKSFFGGILDDFLGVSSN